MTLAAGAGMQAAGELARVVAGALAELARIAGLAKLAKMRMVELRMVAGGWRGSKLEIQ